MVILIVTSIMINDVSLLPADGARLRMLLPDVFREPQPVPRLPHDYDPRRGCPQQVRPALEADRASTNSGGVSLLPAIGAHRLDRRHSLRPVRSPHVQALIHAEKDIVSQQVRPVFEADAARPKSEASTNTGGESSPASMDRPGSVAGGKAKKQSGAGRLRGIVSEARRQARPLEQALVCSRMDTELNDLAVEQARAQEILERKLAAAKQLEELEGQLAAARQFVEKCGKEERSYEEMVAKEPADKAQAFANAQENVRELEKQLRELERIARMEGAEGAVPTG